MKIQHLNEYSMSEEMKCIKNLNTAIRWLAIGVICNSITLIVLAANR